MHPQIKRLLYACCVILLNFSNFGVFSKPKDRILSWPIAGRHLYLTYVTCLAEGKVRSRTGHKGP